MKKSEAEAEKCCVLVITVKSENGSKSGSDGSLQRGS